MCCFKKPLNVIDLLKESQHESRPDAGLTLRQLFWSGCPGVILPIDHKTLIPRKPRLSCLSPGDVQQSAGCGFHVSWPGRAEDGVRSGVGLRLPGLPRRSQSEKVLEQSLMPQGTAAKVERLGSRAHVAGPGRQEPPLPGPPTQNQQAVCCRARRCGGHQATAQQQGSLITKAVHGILLTFIIASLKTKTKRFTKVYFTCDIHPFQMRKSATSTSFTEWCSHCHKLVLRHFPPSRLPRALLELILILPPALGIL